MKFGDFLSELKKPSCGKKKITVNQHGTKDFKARTWELDDIPRTKTSSVLSGAWPHWYCSASIYLHWIWSEWDCQELHSVPNGMRLPAPIFDLLLNFFITESTSPLKLHICITISTELTHFHKKLEKRRMLFSTFWSDPETRLEQFFYWFLKLEGKYVKKRTQTLWIHEIYNYIVVWDWLFPLWMQQMRIPDLSIRKPFTVPCLFWSVVQEL